MRFNCLKENLKTALLVAAVLLPGAGTTIAQQQINLTAGPATAILPDGSTVPMWGYSCGAAISTSAATCASLNPAAAGVPSVWSPVVITVPATAAGGLQINLTNNLSFTPTAPGSTPNKIPTSLMIVGQLGGGLGDTTQRTTAPSPEHPTQQTTWPVASSGPVWTPPAQGNRVQSFGTEVAGGATTLLPAWSSLRPGTYLIESGTHPSIQGPMGLYGILVVTSAPTSTSGTETAAGTAYPGVKYDAEIPLVFSEIDPAQNNAVNAAVNTAGFSETASRGPTVSGAVLEITVTNGGNHYTSPPTVSFSGTGGAAATATIDSSGQVTSIAVTNGGANYTSAPTVILTGGGGSGAAALTDLASSSNSLNTCSTPGGPVAACYPAAINYTPLYYLINGTAFNKTNASASLFKVSPAFTAPATGTGSILVRMVNAGSRMHVPSIIGSLAQQGATGTSVTTGGFELIAEDGNPLPGIPRVQSEVFLSAGKTYDVLINGPAAGGTALPVYDRELSLSGNATEHDTGM